MSLLRQRGFDGGRHLAHFSLASQQRLGCGHHAAHVARAAGTELSHQAYLPQRLSADEVSAAVAGLVAQLGAGGPGDMGRVMAAAKALLAGKAEMGQVSAAVKAALSK